MGCATESLTQSFVPAGARSGTPPRKAWPSLRKSRVRMNHHARSPVGIVRGQDPNRAPAMRDQQSRQPFAGRLRQCIAHQIDACRAVGATRSRIKAIGVQCVPPPIGCTAPVSCLVPGEDPSLSSQQPGAGVSTCASGPALRDPYGMALQPSARVRGHRRAPPRAQHQRKSSAG